MTDLAWWFWRCGECGVLTDEPHTDPTDDADVCADCCPMCSSGATEAWQDQLLKEQGSMYAVGDPMPLHGLPSREQMAAASWGRP